MNLLTKQKQIHRFIKQTYGYQRGWRGRDKSGGWDYHIHPHGSDSKESDCNAGDLGSILGLGRTPGRGHGNPLQYSCLENTMDRGAWQATVQGSQRVGHD